MNDELPELPESFASDDKGADTEADSVLAPSLSVESATEMAAEPDSVGPPLSVEADILADADTVAAEFDDDALGPIEEAEVELGEAEIAGQRKSDRGFVVALLFFISAILLGSLLTSLPTMSGQNWYFWVWLRILAQVGGGVWFGYAFARTMGLGRWQIAAVFMLFGAFISFNALLDGVQGPQLVEGTVEDYETETNYLHDRFGWQAGLRARVEMSQADGTDMTLRPAGAQVGSYSETIRRCRELDQPVQFRILPRLEIILEAHCFLSI